MKFRPSLAGAVLVTMALFFAAVSQVRACSDCGVPHFALLSSDPDAEAARGWLDALEKRGGHVEAFDCRNYRPEMLEEIEHSEVLLLEGGPGGVRDWQPLIVREVQRFLEEGRPVVLLWPTTADASRPAEPGANAALEERLSGIVGVKDHAGAGKGPPTAHPNHRGKPHAILRGVDVGQLPEALPESCVLAEGNRAVVTLGAATPLVWTGEHREANGRVGAVVVVQAGGRDEFGVAAFRKLIANAVFWAIGWDDLIPAKGLPTRAEP